jgi:DhnA family fructose-bisphosphate aldolase class Ia
MKGIEYRLDEFLSTTDRRGLVVDTSAGMVLGALPGLEDYETAVRRVLPAADGLVCSPGQLRRLEGTVKQDAGLLVRIDWTNTLRDASFVLPPEQPMQFPLFSARDALDFGAAGMVISFLLGYAEEVEAACMKTTVTLAMQGQEIGLPLVVEVRTSGPRVSLPGKAVELGASYALEGGADVIVIPDPGPASLKTIGEFVSVPWLLKPDCLDGAAEALERVLALGGAGLWLDHTLFAGPDPAGRLGGLHARLHSPQPETQPDR